MKFLTTPQTWLHILGFGFQHTARYHMEVRSTWFATKILPARERRQGEAAGAPVDELALERD
jgi:hypothetical protein